MPLPVSDMGPPSSTRGPIARYRELRRNGTLQFDPAQQLAIEKLQSLHRALLHYRPETERISHYFDAVLPDQFDAVIHMDRTRALEPLEFGALWQPGEAPETYPSAL